MNPLLNLLLGEVGAPYQYTIFWVNDKLFYYDTRFTFPYPNNKKCPASVINSFEEDL